MVFSQLRDLSLLRWTPRLWNRDPCSLRSMSGASGPGVLRVLTHDMLLTILRSGVRGLKLSARATAWSMLTSFVKFFLVTHPPPCSAWSGSKISSKYTMRASTTSAWRPQSRRQSWLFGRSRLGAQTMARLREVIPVTLCCAASPCRCLITWVRVLRWARGSRDTSFLRHDTW